MNTIARKSQTGARSEHPAHLAHGSVPDAASARLDAALALLRLAAGTVFMAHGAQKLFIYGLAGVAEGFAGMGVPLPGVTAPAVAMVEFLGGFALVVGLLTRVAGVGLAMTMLGALFLVHLPAGFFLPNGFEFVLTLASVAAAIALTGPGKYSVDALRARSRSQL